MWGILTYPSQQREDQQRFPQSTQLEHLPQARDSSALCMSEFALDMAAAKEGEHLLLLSLWLSDSIQLQSGS